jgi:hypothetical protein
MSNSNFVLILKNGFVEDCGKVKTKSLFNGKEATVNRALDGSTHPV